MNIVNININGIEYRLKGDESSEYLNDIAQEVDSKIREMINSNKNFTMQSSSILLAMNYCDKNRKLNKEHERLNKNIDDCNLKIQSLIDENNELKNKIIHIENQNMELNLKNVKLEEEIEAYNTLLKEEKEVLFSENNEMMQMEKEIEVLKDTLKKTTEENLKLKNEMKNKNSIKFS